jgi:hypothetical protein
MTCRKEKELMPWRNLTGGIRRVAAIARAPTPLLVRKRDRGVVDRAFSASKLHPGQSTCYCSSGWVENYDINVTDKMLPGAACVG